ncbi:HEXXH motif-containing protein [Streptomyces sp. 1114.5]|uniref:aKG-HExxH-type peptide beta-hydroxylase n=1 Tax=unclassified Streptomyces TaxID=2593676 RepID=UPI000BD451E2|nr:MULTISPECIES: HEXXH motif-containing putative peptide modification protein [unclassified Streptomyces]RKT16368.1 HEXXH motif-containing protein [Streptomyces sp. 1114.5]SOB82538.1 HEXXH motif-containing protein [Streptomyces sp. 1331.2]
MADSGEAVADGLPRHGMDRATFRAIAAARGGPEAVRLLRAGQLSKRALLLLALRRAAPGHEGYREAYARVRTLQRDDRARWEEVLLRPELDAWAADSLRAVAGGEDVRLGGLSEFIPEGAGVRVRAGRVVELECDGLRWAPSIDHAGPRRVDYGRPPAGPLGDAELAAWEQRLAEAWRVLVRRHRHHAEAVAACVATIVPLHPAPGGEAVSAAARRAYGAVAASLPADPVLLALALVHEFLHVQLGALLDLVPLHRPNGPAVYHAPWRPDLRPAGALLQGAYAHLGVADFWGGEVAAGSGERARAEREFVHWRTNTLTAGRTLLECGELTPYGLEFTEELVAAVRGLRVPAGRA